MCVGVGAITGFESVEVQARQDYRDNLHPVTLTNMYDVIVWTCIQCSGSGRTTLLIKWSYDFDDEYRSSGPPVSVLQGIIEFREKEQ